MGSKRYRERLALQDRRLDALKRVIWSMLVASGGEIHISPEIMKQRLADDIQLKPEVIEDEKGTTMRITL